MQRHRVGQRSLGPLGMQAQWFSEIEKFPSAVLAHHWPRVPNLGDMTCLADWIRCGMVPAPDVLVGGTPCQAFSVAGKRESMDDERGQLTIKYVEILNAIDEKRPGDEAVCVWENVPGVLNTKDNAFGCFLAALSGSSCELQPPGRKWGNAGYIAGPQRTIAWRVLDAQYFGVAQRRRRVFVVASARKGFDPTAVLFEREGVRRDTKPSRETQQEATTDTRSGSHWGDKHNAHPTLNQSHNTGGIAASNQELFSQRGAGLVPFDMAAFGQYGAGLRASTCKARDCKGATDLVTYPIQNATRGKAQNGLGIADPEQAIYTLDTASQHGVRGVAIRGREGGQSIELGGDLANTLRASQGGSDKPTVLGRFVRRLTPVECERLQGFDDNHTRIPWRGKPAEDCPDGPRYKAIGNSKAVPVVRWVGRRLLRELS